MIIIYFYLILMVLLLLVVATYTWFSLSKTPQVSDLSMYVTSRAGLELALEPDSENWGSQLSYTDMVDESSPLRPVTWSDKDQTFYTAVYGIDGRLTGEWQALTDERNANRDTHEGYYCLGTFYARTSQALSVSLTPAVEVEEGISGSGTYLVGTPIWNGGELSHENAGQGAENATRIGLRITPLDANDQPIDGNAQFYIYEPNCDTHIDGSAGYVSTPSIDGAATLVPEERLILQSHSSWTESDPVENGKQNYTFGEFLTPTELFSLEANQKAKIEIYLWLEGQDADCTNAIREAQLVANIQFLADVKQGSGMEPIEQ